MAKHKYPKDLYTSLQQQWSTRRIAWGFYPVDLPEQSVLDEFLSICYHASLLTEEGRPTMFRVALISSSSPVTPPRSEPIPIEPITRYPLGKPIPFTAQEIRRLAPVADPRRVLIAVEQIKDKHGIQFQIYALIDVGMAHWEMAHHRRKFGNSGPDALVAASTQPGELSILRGDRLALRLRGGEIVNPTRSVLLQGPIAEFFYEANDYFIREACEQAGVNQDPNQDDSLSDAHQCFIESILIHVAELKHGGALLFVPDSVVDEDVQLKKTASIKYKLPSTRPHDALLTAMAVRLEHNNFHEKLHSRRTVKREEVESLESLALYQEDVESIARDAAMFIGSLTAVDGAVVLTDKLRVIGFGSEVKVGGPDMDMIHIAHDENGVKFNPVPITTYGTRHRSAFRFVQNIDPSVAFILSQDGGIKAATKVRNQVMMWPYFEVGYSTGL